MSTLRPKTQISQKQTCKIVLNCPTGTVIELVDERGQPIADQECRIQIDGFPALIRVTDVNGIVELSADDLNQSAGCIVDFPQLESAHLSLGSKEQPIENGNTYQCQADKHYQFQYNTRTKVYLGLFFDGTGNSKDDDIETKRLSNVACLNMAFNTDSTVNTYEHYINGVGTQLSNTECSFFSPLDCLNYIRDSELVGGAFSSGAQYRLDFMLEAIERRFSDYPDIQELEIALFGFSRGATLARIFCNWINEQTPSWQERYPSLQVHIRFLGIFDTVSSIGVAGNNIDLGYNKDIPDNVEKVVHMIAAHERRKFFDLQSIRKNGSASPPENQMELIYPGVHSDVGGGYPMEIADSQGRQPRLASISLRDMHIYALENNVPLFTFDKAENDKFLKEYYAIPTALNEQYYLYRDSIQESTNLYESIEAHDQWYFYWLANTQQFIPPNYDDNSKNSITQHWKEDYTLIKKGYRMVTNQKGQRVAKDIHPTDYQNKCMAWLEAHLNTTNNPEINAFFESFVHDSISTPLYRILGDQYLQARGIFFLGDDRWIDEERI